MLATTVKNAKKPLGLYLQSPLHSDKLIISFFILNTIYYELFIYFGIRF